MPYPEHLVTPMREELTGLGVEELRTSHEVADAFDMSSDHTMLLIVNSVCGCAAGMARPAVGLAMENETQPDRMVTVFAGQDLEATVTARNYLVGIPPSSPFMALIKGGDVVYVIERRHIEGRSAQAIAMDLVGAFDKYCGTDHTANDEGPDSPDTMGSYSESPIPSSFQSFAR